MAVQRNTLAISFLCESGRVNKKGESPIYLSLSVNGKRTRFPLMRKANPETFQKLLTAKKSNDLKEYCAAVETKVYQLQTEMIRDGVPFTAANLKEYFRYGGTRSYTLEMMWEEYFQGLNPRKGVSMTVDTYKRYEWVREQMYTRFGKEREVASLSQPELEKMYRDLLDGNFNTTAGQKFQKVKTIMTWAFENGKIPANPTSSIHITKKYKDAVWLTRDEVKKIASHDLSGTKRLEKIRDLFVFQCSCGLAWVDLHELKPEDILFQDGTYYISKKRQKTGIDFTAVILPSGVEVLGRYGGVLPDVPSNQKMNAYLKEICTVCGIEKNITSHSGRHTYAMLLLNSSVRLETVQKCMGHQLGSHETRRYTKLLDSTVIQEVSKVK